MIAHVIFPTRNTTTPPSLTSPTNQDKIQHKPTSQPYHIKPARRHKFSLLFKIHLAPPFPSEAAALSSPRLQLRGPLNPRFGSQAISDKNLLRTSRSQREVTDTRAPSCDTLHHRSWRCRPVRHRQHLTDRLPRPPSMYLCPTSLAHFPFGSSSLSCREMLADLSDPKEGELTTQTCSLFMNPEFPVLIESAASKPYGSTANEAHDATSGSVAWTWHSAGTSVHVLVPVAFGTPVPEFPLSTLLPDAENRIRGQGIDKTDFTSFPLQRTCKPVLQGARASDHLDAGGGMRFGTPSGTGAALLGSGWTPGEGPPVGGCLYAAFPAAPSLRPAAHGANTASLVSPVHVFHSRDVLSRSHFAPWNPLLQRVPFCSLSRALPAVRSPSALLGTLAPDALGHRSASYAHFKWRSFQNFRVGLKVAVALLSDPPPPSSSLRNRFFL
ncbi:hypothetical protein C7M84_000964 [Penaeus vannamei]|uniref:Uncharacterized protein n=1 Tax=Penaeus vannamei TaxID=6689 RepID=A0A423TV35_PENVA|nr:hypothetical protein C7M84_000964 [Penaeus vannamei]